MRRRQRRKYGHREEIDEIVQVTNSIGAGDARRFRAWLAENERSEATIAKYLRDVDAFRRFLNNRPISKELVIAYKEELRQGYSVASANSMLAAINRFLVFRGLPEYRVKLFRIQHSAYIDAERELTRAEYFRLLEVAAQKGNLRLEMLLMTIGGTGVRVSELQYITAEAVRKGHAVVNLKGKHRTILIAGRLRKRLMAYMQKAGIQNGSLFVTRSGRPLDRSNIWKEMKSLCEAAKVSPGKVFPHNIRHLFARCYYQQNKDIVKLADILGHSSIDTTRIYLVDTGERHLKTLEKTGLIA